MCALAQLNRESPAGVEVLPDAPGYETAPPSADASVAGTVLDTNGDVIQGATVSLVGAAGKVVRTTISGDNGQFNFSSLQPGTFRVIVTGQGMGKFDSGEFVLRAEEVHTVSQVILPVSATAADVTVVANREEIAEEQVHIAIEQRALGVLPNFYSTYDWNAPPMGSKQKYELAFRAIIDPVAFAGAGFVSGIEQANGTYRGYGGGIGGYSKRFGASYADDVAGRMLSSAVFPALFHQDPRYFYKGTGSKKSRLFYALAGAVITRSDSGHTQPNYSHLLGGLAAGGLSNLYYPAESQGISHTLVNWAIGTAGHAGNNVMREFILKGLTPKKGGGTEGSP
ncbi:MAG: carboxypeptidase-like regulatory domain-containing protein [Terracidiphilus sp.]